jgi:hypothetical protein
MDTDYSSSQNRPNTKKPTNSEWASIQSSRDQLSSESSSNSNRSPEDFTIYNRNGRRISELTEAEKVQDAAEAAETAAAEAAEANAASAAANIAATEARAALAEAEALLQDPVNPVSPLGKIWSSEVESNSSSARSRSRSPGRSGNRKMRVREKYKHEKQKQIADREALFDQRCRGFHGDNEAVLTAVEVEKRHNNMISGESIDTDEDEWAPDESDAHSFRPLDSNDPTHEKYARENDHKFQVKTLSPSSIRRDTEEFRRRGCQPLPSQEEGGSSNSRLRG